MKKLLTLGLLVVVLGACASNAPASKGPEEDNQPKTEEKPLAKVIDIIPQEIFANEQEVKLTYRGLETYPDFWAYRFSVENSNDFVVHVKTQEVFLNGTRRWGTTEAEIDPYDTKDIFQAIYERHLIEDDLVGKVDSIELVIALYRYDTMELIYETPVLRIMFNPK